MLGRRDLAQKGQVETGGSAPPCSLSQVVPGPVCLVTSPRGSSFLPQDLLRGDLGSLSLYSQAGSWPLEPCVLPSLASFVHQALITLQPAFPWPRPFLPSRITADCFHHGLPGLPTRFSCGSGLPNHSQLVPGSEPRPPLCPDLTGFSIEHCLLGTCLSLVLSVHQSRPSLVTGSGVQGILPQPRAA